MSDPIVFLKIYSMQILYIVLTLVGTSVYAYFLFRKPEKLGLKKPVDKYFYFLMALPTIVTIIFIIRDSREGITYPTGLAVHENTIILKGIFIEIRERAENENITYEEYHSKYFLFDRNTGKRTGKFDGLPLYARKNKLLADGGMGYDIVDLASGEVMEIITENKINETLAALAKEKIHAFSLSGSGPYFSVQTVRDKKFNYDVLHNEANIPDGPSLFHYNSPSRSEFTNHKTDLFKAELLTVAPDGTTLVVSYDDLEKESFLVSAIASDGSLRWTKRDFEISDDLVGERFAHPDYEHNTIADESNLYFVNKYRIVCMDLKDGSTKWVNDDI